MDNPFLSLLGILALVLLAGIVIGACVCWLLSVRSTRKKDMHRRAKEYTMQQAEFDMLHGRISDMLGVLHQINKQLAGPILHEAEDAIGSESQQI